jgi:hypothetical protein
LRTSGRCSSTQGSISLTRSTALDEERLGRGIVGDIEAARHGEHGADQLGGHPTQHQARVGQLAHRLVGEADVIEDAPVELPLKQQIAGGADEAVELYSPGDILAGGLLMLQQPGSQAQGEGAAANLAHHDAGEFGRKRPVALQHGAGGGGAQPLQAQRDDRLLLQAHPAHQHGPQLGEGRAQVRDHGEHISHILAAAALHLLEGVEHQQQRLAREGRRGVEARELLAGVECLVE